MEVDAVVLIIVVITVSLTTFVCSVLGKYCFENLLLSKLDKRSRRQRSSRSSRCHGSRHRQIVHCHGCTIAPQPRPYGRRTTRLNSAPDHVAVNICQPSPEDDIKLYTFSRGAPKPENLSHSQTFARLGMRASKDGECIDFDQRLRATQDSEMHFNVVPPAPSGPRQFIRQVNFAQQSSSFNNYEDVSAIRNPGDGQNKEELGKQKNENFRPGNSGPVKNANSLSVFKLPQNKEIEDDTKDTYNKLGIAQDENGDRLTPLSAILEAATNTSSSGVNTVISNTINSTYEQPLESYDVVNARYQEEYKKTQEISEDDDEVFCLNAHKVKRFSFPMRNYRHCSTCSCRHNFRPIAKRTSEEMFEQESAKKASMTITETALLPKNFKLIEPENQRRKLLLLEVKTKEV